jgi:hypothetical protein
LSELQATTLPIYIFLARNALRAALCLTGKILVEHFPMHVSESCLG